jgi:hypothetical protein
LILSSRISPRTLAKEVDLTMLPTTARPAQSSKGRKGIVLVVLRIGKPEIMNPLKGKS